MGKEKLNPINIEISANYNADNEIENYSAHSSGSLHDTMHLLAKALASLVPQSNEGDAPIEEVAQNWCRMLYLQILENADIIEEQMREEWSSDDEDVCCEHHDDDDCDEDADTELPCAAGSESSCCPESVGDRVLVFGVFSAQAEANYLKENPEDVVPLIANCLMRTITDVTETNLARRIELIERCAECLKDFSNDTKATCLLYGLMEELGKQGGAFKI